MLYERLAQHERNDGTAIFVQTPSGAMSYRDCKARVDALAGVLKARGLRRGDRCMVMLPNGTDFVVAVLAIAKLGAIAVPVGTTFKADELRRYVMDSAPKVVATTEALAVRHREAVRSVSNARILTQLTFPRTTVPPVREMFDGDVLYQYSLGATGVPKRVVRTQTQLIAEAEQFASTIALSASDKLLTAVPMCHAHGFGNCLVAALTAGACILVLERFDRRLVMQALTSEQVTVFHAVPFMFSLLATSKHVTTTSMPNLRLALSAGAPLDESSYVAFRDKFGVAILQQYGSTETGAISVNLDPDPSLWQSVGQPLAGTEVLLINDSGIPAPPGTVGEVVVRSPAMATGYSSLALTREAFRDGYYWTGDLARADRAGNITLCGRKKQLITTSENQVDPTEVEAVIAQHPAVAETVVLGVPGPRGTERVKAVVVSHQDCTAEEITQWCRDRLAPYKAPRIVAFRDELPRSPLGKILRKYLQEETGLAGG